MSSRIAAALLCGLTTLVACGGDDDSSETSSKSVDIGDGRTMFLDCVGEGEPTVILESGIHDSSEYWTVSQLLPPAVDPPVMSGLADTNRVCRYDRPGTVVPGEPPMITDRSRPVAMPRTIGDAVSDLHTLLEVADVPGAYLVVAHSWGGMIGQLYVRTYPEEVVGFVLVDAFAPALRDLLGDEWAAYIEVLNNPPGETFNTSANYEIFNIDASIAQLLAAPDTPDIPLVVMSKTAPFPDFPPESGVTNDDLDAIWPDAQQTLVDLLPNTPHEIATGSIHYIQVTEPDLVITAVRLVIERRDGAS